MTNVLILPGWGDSGPEHWQSLWEAQNPAFVRVVQRDWLEPVLTEWLDTLDDHVRRTSRPIVLVAHSLACALVVHWVAAGGSEKVTGALLVAPADVESEAHTPPEVRGFAPIPRVKLPFPTIVVASRNDPYVRFERAVELAAAWGAEVIDAGPRGHLNSESRLGEWPEGLRLLRSLLHGG